MSARLVSTTVEVPREWLAELPGEWKCLAYDFHKRPSSPFRVNRVCDMLACVTVNPCMFTYEVEIPAGGFLPKHLCPENVSVLTKGGIAIGAEGHSAWLPLPEVG